MGKVFNIHSSKRVHAKDYTKTGVPFYRSMEVVSLAKGLEPTIQYYISEEQYQCFVEDGYLSLIHIYKRYYVRTSCCGTLYELDPGIGRAIAHGGQVNILPQHLMRVNEGTYHLSLIHI